MSEPDKSIHYLLGKLTGQVKELSRGFSDFKKSNAIEHKNLMDLVTGRKMFTNHEGFLARIATKDNIRYGITIFSSVAATIFGYLYAMARLKIGH